MSNNEMKHDQVLASAIRTALKIITKSANSISDHLHANPNDTRAAIQGLGAINEQLEDLLDQATDYSDDCACLQRTIAEMKQSASGWVSGSYSCGEDKSVHNSYGSVVKSFDALLVR